MAQLMTTDERQALVAQLKQAGNDIEGVYAGIVHLLGTTGLDQQEYSELQGCVSRVRTAAGDFRILAIGIDTHALGKRARFGAGGRR